MSRENINTWHFFILWYNYRVENKITKGMVKIMRFDYEKIMQENTVVHCETREQAIILSRWALSKDSYLEVNDWDIYNENTCYNLYSSMFGNLKFYQNENYT